MEKKPYPTEFGKLNNPSFSQAGGWRLRRGPGGLGWIGAVL